MNNPAPNRRSVYVFRSLAEISFVSFPSKLAHMLVVVCKTGEVSAVIDVEHRTLLPGCMMVLRPGHMISQCKESEDFEGFFIVVPEERLDELVPSLHYIIPYSLHYNANPVIEMTDEEMEAEQAICEMLQKQLWHKGRPFNRQAMVSLCESLFYITLGMYASRVQAVRFRSRREELLAAFIDLLEANFRTERSVNFYAGKLCVTPKHLSAVLKETSRRTAGEWIDHRVILEAKLLLRSTGMNIQEISIDLNFSNQSFFGKYFKHLTGISPREYRNRSFES